MPFVDAEHLQVWDNWRYRVQDLGHHEKKKKTETESNLPPQTGQPVKEPPCIARGSSIVDKNGGTLRKRLESGRIR